MRVPALLVVGALCVGACGGGDRRSDADQVRETLGAFGAATARHDYGRVCRELLAKPVIDSVRPAGLDCQEALRTALQDVQAPKMEVRHVTVNGDHASARVHTTAANQDASDDTVALVKEGGEWKIGSLVGG